MDGEENQRQKTRKRVNIPPSEVKPLDKQTNNVRGAHIKGVKLCRTTKCLSRLPTPYFVSPHELHKHKQRAFKFNAGFLKWNSDMCLGLIC